MRSSKFPLIYGFTVIFCAVKNTVLNTILRKCNIKLTAILSLTRGIDKPTAAVGNNAM